MEIATKILKDGMLVEVKAGHGLIRIIKNNMDQFIKFPKTVNFYKPVTRKESPLALGFMSNMLTTREDYKDVLSVDFQMNTLIYLNRDLYYDLNEVDELRDKLFSLKKKDKDIFIKLSEKCEKKSRDIINYSEKIRKSDLAKYDYKELMLIFNEYFGMMKSYIPYLFLPLAVERVYNEKITSILEKKLGREKGEKYLGIVIFPQKQNLDYYEHIGFLDIALEYKKKQKSDKPIKILISKHLEKFSRMGQRYGIGNIWTEKDIIDRLKFYHTDPLAEKELLIKDRKDNAKKTAAILKEINAADDLKKMVKVIKEYVYLRTLRTEVINFSYANMNNLFKEIGARNNLSFDLVNFSLYQEIVNNNFKPENEIKERMNGFGYITDRKNSMIITGNLIKRAEEFYGFVRKKKSVSFVKGQIANPGKARGKAKIVMDNSMLNKVEKGDILIAPMTTPDYIAAMQKATAFITDEGGILCHASIVSREMKKPCIIGTKIATQVLKDGDMIEVDADKGIIKVLK